MITQFLSKRSKNYIKPILKSYFKFFPKKKLVLENKEFTYNIRANSFFPFRQKQISKRDEIINFNRISKNVYNDIGQKTYDGIHPEVKELYPSACSFVPYFENQSNLVFTNFLSTHYGLNNPQIVLLRYESQKGGEEEIVEKYKTLILLPEQTIWFNENFVSKSELSQFSKGQLFVYLFDPLFKPSQSQIRYHAVYENNSFPTCGVHSWVSYKDELVISHKQFLSRRFMPHNETNNNYLMIPPFGKIIKCISDKKKLNNTNTNNNSIVTLPHELRPEESTQRGGFFVKLDKDNFISRIWHDNGTGVKYPVKQNLKKNTKETDFCFPLEGYYFNLIIPNPVEKNLIIEKNIKISAYQLHSDQLFLEEQIQNSEIINPNNNFFAFEIKLKNFFQKINTKLSQQEKKDNQFIRINIKFETSNLDDTELEDEITTFIYMFDNNDNICDQIHTEWSKGSIFGGKKFISYRTNKFAPFKVKKDCESFAILKNKFSINQKEKDIKNHKLRVTVNYSKKINGEKVFLNKTKYLNFDVNHKFHLINIREVFFQEEKDLMEISGGVHIFCSTLNSWGYWMIQSNNGKGRQFLACDHLTGG